MTDYTNDDYWINQFAITHEDLNRIADHMEHENVPQDLKALALRIVRGRLVFGHDLSPTVLSQMTGKASVRLWDPAGEWQIGDTVLVTYDRFANDQYEAYLGEIVSTDENMVTFQIEELQDTLSYERTLPGSENAQKYSSDVEIWRNTLRESVDKKLQSGDLDEQSKGILLKHGEQILSRLSEILESDLRFTNLEGKWFIAQKLPNVDNETIKTIHQTLLQKPDETIDEILLANTPTTKNNEPLLRMAIHTAMQQIPERFENVGTSVRPKWKAKLPEPSRAEVTHFAYDTQTFEILCRPSLQLNQKQAQRLQELNLYAHVVTFVE